MLKQQEHKKLERLMLFSEVAKQLSFTKAADFLNISRGHLSHQIKVLEQELGTVLLVRSTRSVKLTQAGQNVLASMAEIKQVLLTLNRKTREDITQISGQIKITAPQQFAQCYLFDICQQFKNRYPNIEFAIDISYTNFDLHRSDFDLAFRATNQPPQNMVAKKLFDYQHICCAAPSYINQYGAPTSVAELSEHQCLSWNSRTLWWLDDREVEVNGWLATNDNRQLVAHALQGQGIIKQPDYTIANEIEAGTLIKVLAECKTEQRSIYLLHPQLLSQSKRLHVFSQFVQAYFDN